MAKPVENEFKQLPLTESETKLLRRALKGKKLSEKDQKAVDDVGKTLKRLWGKK